MKYIKLFEEFQNELNEGSIVVYPPGSPFKKEGSIQWTGVEKHMTKWKNEGNSLSLVADFDFDKYTANKEYQSVPHGTWGDKSLPKFLSKNPGYDESEFDFVSIEPNQEKPNEPWIKIVDKKGVEFMIPPFRILEIQKGNSVVDNITSGETFLIDSMRAKIVDYRDKTVYVKMQDGSKREYKLEDWKKERFMPLEEKKSNS